MVIFHSYVTNYQKVYNHKTGWWFGTWILIFYIFGTIIPFEFHIFQRGFSTTNQWFSKAIFWAGWVQDPRPTFKLLSYGLCMFMDVYGRYDCDYYNIYTYMLYYIYVILYIYYIYIIIVYLHSIVTISLLCMV